MKMSSDILTEKLHNFYLIDNLEYRWTVVHIYQEKNLFVVECSRLADPENSAIIEDIFYYDPKLPLIGRSDDLRSRSVKDRTGALYME